MSLNAVVSWTRLRMRFSRRVAGITDRYACRRAVTLLDWPLDRLPSGVDR